MKPMGDRELALALALDGAVAPASDEAERLVVLARALEVVAAPDIDPAFAARLEARLMTEVLEQAPEAQPALRVVRPAPPFVAVPKSKPAPVVMIPRRRFVVRKALVAAIAAAMLMALPIAASASALPGTPFYSVKEWRQSVQLHFSSGAAKAFRHEQIARETLAEGAQLTTIGADPRMIQAAFDKANRHQRDAVAMIIDSANPALIKKMLRMIDADRGLLVALQPAAQHDARPAIHEALTETDVLSVRLARALGYPAAVPVRLAPATLAAADAASSKPASRTSGTIGGTSTGLPKAEAPTKTPPRGETPEPPEGSRGTGADPTRCGMEGDAGAAAPAIDLVNELAC